MNCLAGAKERTRDTLVTVVSKSHVAMIPVDGDSSLYKSEIIDHVA